ncbi:Glucomannan 4-beta-mannosyltransferase 2, partial [Mucuna pruriens]
VDILCERERCKGTNYNIVLSGPKLEEKLDFSDGKVLMFTHLRAHNILSFIEPGKDHLTLFQIHQGVYYSIFFLDKIANIKRVKEERRNLRNQNCNLYKENMKVNRMRVDGEEIPDNEVLDNHTNKRSNNFNNGGREIIEVEVKEIIEEKDVEISTKEETITLYHTIKEEMKTILVLPIKEPGNTFFILESIEGRIFDVVVQIRMVCEVIKAPLIVPMFNVCVYIFLAMAFMLFMERVYMSIIIILKKLEQCYKYEPLQEDEELKNSNFLVVLVQILIFNEKKVYKVSIGAACNLVIFHDLWIVL